MQCLDIELRFLFLCMCNLSFTLSSSGEFAPEWQKKDVLSADASLEDELNYFR